tara:strand:- start:258 stop:713 length:456 start_codon:yes stop_codon:yes gene_type:complete
MQGKSNKQYEDSARFSMVGYIGIIVIIMALLLGVGEMTGFNDEMGEKIKNDPRPTNHLYNYMHPNQWLDTIEKPSDELLDSLELIDPDMMYHREEYHGKEGKNGEWGEYVQSDDWNQGPCGGDDWVDENEMHYLNDELHMWIGNDGDTIWE